MAIHAALGNVAAPEGLGADKNVRDRDARSAELQHDNQTVPEHSDVTNIQYAWDPKTVHGGTAHCSSEKPRWSHLVPSGAWQCTRAATVVTVAIPCTDKDD